MNPGNNIKVVGTFVKVLKKDGSMLFKPSLKDSSFISELKYIYHSEFNTKWEINSIQSAAKGFHIKLAGVNDFNTAEYFIGESFGVDEKEIAGKSLDLLIGEKVYFLSNGIFGEIISLSQTPSYILFEVEKENGQTAYIPFTDEFISINDGKIELLRET